MNKAPSLQWYPDKWLADTRRLSWKAKGLYFDLLNVIWMQFQQSCSIPDDEQFISKELGCSIDEWREARAEIMIEHRPLMELKSNRLFSNGLLKEYAKQQLRREHLAENGRKGGRPKSKRLFSEKPNESRTKAEKSLPSPSSSPTPSPSSKEKSSPSGQSESDFWDKIKALYTWVNVDQERAKMQAWLLTERGKRRKITKGFVINWLNKIDKPMDGQGQQQQGMSSKAQYEKSLNECLLALDSADDISHCLSILRTKYTPVNGQNPVQDAYEIHKKGKQHGQ